MGRREGRLTGMRNENHGLVLFTLMCSVLVSAVSTYMAWCS